MIVGQRVAERMKALGLSQAELARRVGVSQPSIYKLIHENKTGTARIHQVARELRTTPAYLSGETDDPDSDVPDDALTAEERASLEQLRQLGERDRQAVLQLLRSLTEAQGEKPTVHAPAPEYRAQKRG